MKKRSTINLVNLENLIRKNIKDFFSQPCESENKTRNKTMWEGVLKLAIPTKKRKVRVRKAKVLNAFRWYTFGTGQGNRKDYMDLLKKEIMEY